MAVFLVYMAMPGILYFIVEAFFGSSVIKNDKTKKKFLVLFGMVMALMIGLRSPANGSGDTMFYCYHWVTLSKASFSEFKKLLTSVDMEVGYQTAVWILTRIFKNPQWLLFISGCFISISVCRFVYCYCKNPVLGLIVFNCLGLFSFMVQGLRQAIAMCICLWAIDLCKSRKFLKFVIVVALASLFHASAIVFIITYFLSFNKLNVKSWLLFVFFGSMVAVFLPSFFALVNTIINDNYSIGQGSEQGGIVAILIYIAILLFGLMFADKTDKCYPLFIYMACIGLSCMVLRRLSSGIIERINNYFAFSQMAIISNSTYSIINKKSRAIISILAFGLCFLVAIYKASYSDLVPYLFFWQ